MGELRRPPPGRGHPALEVLTAVNLSPLDLVPLGAYFVVIVGLGWLKRRNFKGEAYLLMGRQLTLPGFVLSLVSTWYGGILGSSEYSYTVGLSNWIVLGIPYYVFAGVFAIFLARRARRSYVYSVPDLLAGCYGERARLPASLLVLVLASPAPYVLTFGVLLNFLFGVPVIPGILIGGIFSYLYVYRDGLAVIVRTDLFQCLLMYTGYGLLLVGAWFTFGSPFALWQELSRSAPDHVSLTGGKPVSYVMVWFFIASWTLVAPMFHQRVYALRNEKHARLGITLSIAAWTVFDLFTTFAGLYAFANFPGIEDPRISHFLMAETLLPAGLYGLFLTGIFATVMSTLDSELFVSGVTLGPDMLGRTRGFKGLSEPVLTRIGMAGVLVAAILLAIFVPSVVDLYYTIGTLAVPGLLVPVLGATGLIRPLPPRLIRLHLLGVPLFSLLWFLGGELTGWYPLVRVEPFYPGIALSAIILLFGYRESLSLNGDKKNT